MSRGRKRGASVRLQKYVAGCGHCSRRHAELLIQAGLVLVNGTPAQLGTNILPGRDEVTINGDLIEPPTLHYLALHKPRGFITAEHDTHERLTVMDLMPRRFVHDGVSPVGRLDLDTSGLLLMTNDGDLAHRIAHPSYDCPKLYRATVKGNVGPQAVDRLRKGVKLEDGWTSPAEVEIAEKRARETVLLLTLGEGKKRQVRRMGEAVGHPVLVLERLRVGPVELADLAEGAWRSLEEEELGALRAIEKK